ncbi:MAG: hypothetical protein ABSA44_03990 [Bacteroidota bacterium]
MDCTGGVDREKIVAVIADLGLETNRGQRPRYRNTRECKRVIEGKGSRDKDCGK